MTWKEVLDIILIVGLFGSLFNIFVGAEIESEFPRLKERWVFVIIGILYVLESFVTYKIMMYDKYPSFFQSWKFTFNLGTDKYVK